MYAQIKELIGQGATQLDNQILTIELEYLDCIIRGHGADPQLSGSSDLTGLDALGVQRFLTLAMNASTSSLCSANFS
jgi:hypothetical protein